MNIKHLFFCMLLITFSSCSKPGYEKAIAEWVQTDSHGTWTDLKYLSNKKLPMILPCQNFYLS